MSKVTSKWSAVNCFKEHAYICALSLDCPTHPKNKATVPPPGPTLKGHAVAIRRPTGTSEYTWMDGTQLDYVIWERYVSVNPSRCIAINTDAFYWVEHECNQLSAFVCKRPAQYG
uniref:C-type lectin domain-containing protein n=1 Tax=Parascaris equorum TaxID=6256 RepID=A0A914RVS2_PAREQ